MPERGIIVKTSESLISRSASLHSTTCWMAQAPRFVCVLRASAVSGTDFLPIASRAAFAKAIRPQDQWSLQACTGLSKAYAGISCRQVNYAGKHQKLLLLVNFSSTQPCLPMKTCSMAFGKDEHMSSILYSCSTCL